MKWTKEEEDALLSNASTYGNTKGVSMYSNFSGRSIASCKCKLMRLLKDEDRLTKVYEFSNEEPEEESMTLWQRFIYRIKYILGI